MTNQHAGLGQVLAEQRITERREQAARARLAHAGRPPRSRPARAWWRLARRLGSATEASRTTRRASCAR